MRRSIYAAAAAALAIAPITAASAGTWSELGVDAVVDSSNSCGFTAKQISGGFLCYVATTTETVHRTIGSGKGTKCQQGTRTTTTYYAVNKNDNIMDTRTATVNDEFAEDGEVEWSGNHVAGACAS